jgi:hypothetical protein
MAVYTILYAFVLTCPGVWDSKGNAIFWPQTWYVLVLLVHTCFMDVLWRFSLESYTPGQGGSKSYQEVYTAMQHIMFFHDMEYDCMYSLVQRRNRVNDRPLALYYLNCQHQVCTGMYKYVPVHTEQGNVYTSTY